MYKRWFFIGLSTIFCLGLIAAAAVAIAAAFAYPQLPAIDALTEYKPRIPLRIYTADNVLIGEYGQERRTFVKMDNTPKMLIHAILAAEDDHFFEHSGVDITGIARAVINNFSGKSKQGGSTITMQVARNFYLSSEKNYTRKFYEILLSFKIEKNLSKNQILEVYINQIFLGRHSFGFAEAAQTYYGKALDQLTVGECAMLAGLPKAPSKYNPYVNLKRAQERQRYVLGRMKALNYIDETAYTQALSDPIVLATGKDPAKEDLPTSVHAEYVAEMARQLAYDQFKEEAYTRGIKIITTITSADQQAAYEALRKGVLEYERRHSYRGAEAYVDLSQVGTSDKNEALGDLIDPYLDQDEIKAAIVLEASPKEIKAYLRNGEIVTVTGKGLKFASTMLAKNAPPQKQIRSGAIIRLLQAADNTWAVTQIPEVEAAFVSLDPKTGAIKSLVGGFDFNRNKFNHVTQAWRQPGSSFKPFIYSAALEKGFAPSSIVNDAPLFFTSAQTGGKAWQPQNYEHTFEGPTSLRMALAHSTNVVAVSVLNSIGPAYAQDFVTTRFGFDKARQPAYLTMALGAGSATPWQMASAYSVFANGGFRIQPFIVKEMLDETGQVIARVDPPVAGAQATQVLDPRNAYLMDSMLQDVIRKGTGSRAYRAIRRNDIAGKTGTTSDYVDGWFCGYQPTLVGIAWMGFDQPKRLGSGETGSALALPIWIGYMSKALKDVPVKNLPQPQGLVRITLPDGGTDLVYKEFIPTELPPATEGATTEGTTTAGDKAAEKSFWEKITGGGN